MRILIASDLHANLEAVRSLPEDYDELWVLGDLVNYGPNPGEVIEFVRAKASLVVRGNHDHAAGYGQDPQCSPRFRRMAEETGWFTKSVLTEAQRAFLRELPLRAEREVGAVRALACHAAPENPLYEYRNPDSDLWEADLAQGAAGLLLTGHTHLPFRRTYNGRTVVNPGSVGQPKHGRAEARYAIWGDGEIRLESAAYAVEETIAKVRALPVSAEVQDDLITVLRTGSAVK